MATTQESGEQRRSGKDRSRRATMRVTNSVASLLWRWPFNTEIPRYPSGVVGGVTALPMWGIAEACRISADPAVSKE